MRLTPVYGEGFLLNVTKRICLAGKAVLYRVGSGEQRLSLCSVQNIADLVEYVLGTESCRNKTLIVKDEKDYSVNEIIGTLREVFGKRHGFLVSFPVNLVNSLVSAIGLISSEKERFYRYQIDKITHDCIYRDKELRSAGVRLKWDMERTLLGCRE